MQQFLRFPFLRMEKLFFAFTWYEFHDSDLIIVSKVVVALFLEAKLNLESKIYFYSNTYNYLELYICQKSLFNRDQRVFKFRISRGIFQLAEFHLNQNMQIFLPF